MMKLASKKCSVTMTRVVREAYEFKGHDGQSRTGETAKSIPDGSIEGEVEIRVDVESLFAQLAGRALKSKGGRSVVANGAVEVVVVSKRRIPARGLV